MRQVCGLSSGTWRRLGVLALCATAGAIAAAHPAPASARGGSAGASAARASTPGAVGASGLRQRLAVLNRPQVSSDVLARRQLPPLAPELVSSLTRRLASPAGATVYLVVLRPTAASARFWRPRQGDLAALATLDGSRFAQLTPPLPAAYLDDANFAYFVPASGHGVRGYDVQLVPDGVAQVDWTFAGERNAGLAHVTAAATDNLAIAPAASTVARSSDTRWLSSTGASIPTSGVALVRAEAAARRALHRQMVDAASHPRYRPAAALLRDFSIFAVTSRTGVRVGAVTVRQPPVSQLPAVVLSLADQRHALAHPELDAVQTREAITDTGTRIYVVPGARGMCVVMGSGGGCNDDLAQVLSDGLSVTVGAAGHGEWHYGIRPADQPTLTVAGANGGRRTFRLSDGIYAYHTGP